MSNNDNKEEKKLDDLSEEELREQLKEKDKKVKELDAQRKHKHKKLEKLKEELEGDGEDSSQEDSYTQEVNPDKINQLEEKVTKVERSNQKRNFQYRHNLSPEQVDYLFDKIDGDPKEELENPATQAALNSIASQKKVEDNTPSSSSNKFSTAQKKDDKNRGDKSKTEKQKEYEKRQKERGML